MCRRLPFPWEIICPMLLCSGIYGSKDCSVESAADLGWRTGGHSELQRREPHSALCGTVAAFTLYINAWYVGNQSFSTCCLLKVSLHGV